MMTEDLLKILGAAGEMRAQDFVRNVPRHHNDYRDFYPAAALMDAGYIATDGHFTSGKVTTQNRLGSNSFEIAVAFCQLSLPAGESFQINKCPRDSWHDFPCILFMTAEGYLRLDELEKRRIERRRKRMDYIVSLTVAVLVAIISSSLTHYFATRRAALERRIAPSLASPERKPSP